MAGPAYVVEGARELAASLRRASRDLAMRPEQIEAGRMIAADATARAPRRTGALAGSVRPTVSTSGPIVEAGGPSVPYAGYVEYGTRNMSARPFMRPAATAATPRVVSLFSRAVDRIISRIRGA